MSRIKEKCRDTCGNDPLGWPFLVVAEVRKGESGRKRLELPDLLGSVSIGYEPDRVIFLERDHDASTESVTRINLRVAKARHGNEVSLSLNFRFNQFRFEAFEPLIKLPAAKTSISNIKPAAIGNLNKLDPYAGS